MVLKLVDRQKVECDSWNGGERRVAIVTLWHFRLRRERHLIVIVEWWVALVSGLQRRFTKVVHLRRNQTPDKTKTSCSVNTADLVHCGMAQETLAKRDTHLIDSFSGEPG